MRSQETPSSVDFFPKTDALDTLSDRHTWRSKGVQHTSCLVAREEEGTMVVLIGEGTGVLGAKQASGKKGQKGKELGFLSFYIRKADWFLQSCVSRNRSLEKHGPRNHGWRKDGGHSPHRDQSLNVPT